MFADQLAMNAQAPTSAGSRRLADAMSVGFLSIGANGRLVDCNPGAERLFGRRREELIGHPSWEVAGLGRTTPFGTLLHKVAEKQIPEDAEIIIRNNEARRRGRLPGR
jgi:PAS domain S-box-containing protein